MGVLALVLVMQTDRGREILKNDSPLALINVGRKELLGLAVKENVTLTPDPTTRRPTKT
jgi:hypothetical protein